MTSAPNFPTSTSTAPTCPRCGIMLYPSNLPHQCPALQYALPAPLTMWCAVCCMDDAAAPWNSQPAVTQVGLLWVCGPHVQRALELAQQQGSGGVS